MLQIIKKVIITLIIVIIIDKIFSYTFTNYIFKKTISGESGGTINYVINKKSNLDFLIIGPSRAKHGIDPSIITSLGNNGYNLGINGTTVLNSLLILDILVKNNVKMKTLIVSADLSDYVKESKEETIDQIKRVYPYDTPLINEYVSKIGNVEQIKYFFGLYKLNRKILNVSYNFTKRNTVTDNNGYVGLPNMTDKPDVKYDTENFIYKKDSTNVEALKKIKKICDENNIKLIVIFSPSYKNVFYNEIQQKLMIEDFKKENINNIIDLSNINQSPDLLKEENWRDAIHFNYFGSQKFSKILSEEIIKRKIYKNN